MIYLLRNGANVNEQIGGNGLFGPSIHGHTALSIAMTQESVSIEVVEILLKYRADPRLPISVDGETFTDLTFYLARKYTSLILHPTNTPFSHLARSLDYQVEMLNN